MLRTNTTTCARLLAYVTGLVNQQLLPQNEYLAAENRILKARLRSSWRLSNGERATLAEIGKRLGRKGLQQVARWDRTRARPALGGGLPFLPFRLQDGFTFPPWLTFPAAPL